MNCFSWSTRNCGNWGQPYGRGRFSYALLRTAGQSAFSTREGANGAGFRLFKRTWDNLRPEVEVESFDFTSTVTKCSPFLIALTLE